MTAPRKTNNYVDRNGLLIPKTVQLRDELATQRHADAIAREDEQARKAGKAYHRNRLAEIAEKASAARRARRDRKRDTREQADLNRLYRVAVRSGTRARIRADIQRSAEMRALRIGKVRAVALVAGMPILSAFAAWSTAGAQAGAVRLLNLDEGGAGWWAAWGIEPALIAIVALIIIGKAVLRSSGGDIDWRASIIEWAALGTSLGLNIFGGWVGGLGGVKTVLPHAIGPTFCALTALLIGLFVGYAADAKPWDEAPRLTDMGFVADQDTTAATVIGASAGEDLAEIAQLPVLPPTINGEAPTDDFGDFEMDMDPGHDGGQELDTSDPDTSGSVPDNEDGHAPDTEQAPAADITVDTPTGHAPAAAGDTLTGTAKDTTRTPRRTTRRTPDRTPKWTREQLKAFRLRDTQDMTYPLIAREVGVSEKTVSRWFKARDAAEPGTDAGPALPTVTFTDLPLADPKPAVTHGVNGRTYPTEETHS